MRPLTPGNRPKVVEGYVLRQRQERKVDENAELLMRGGSPVGEGRARGETFSEDGAEVRREREVEGGFDIGEFGVVQAWENRDVERF